MRPKQTNYDDATDFYKSVDNAELDNSEHNSKTRGQKWWKIYSIIAFVLVVLSVIFYVSIGPEQESKNITPLDNMTVEEENNPSPGTFSIDE